jgi:hypothetical protein
MSAGAQKRPPNIRLATLHSAVQRVSRRAFGSPSPGAAHLIRHPTNRGPMTNLQRAPLLLLLALMIISASPSAAAGPSKAMCSPKGTKTLAASSRVRIYRAAPTPSQGRAVSFYGCLKSSGKSGRIGPVKRGGGNASMSGPFGFKSTWAGAVENRQVGDTTWVYVAARDIQAGGGKHCLVGSADRGAQRPAVRVLLIDDRAEALVWAAITPSPTGRAPLIGACDTRGTRVLDSGAGVEIKTLELHGSTVSWEDAGGPRTAQLR